MEKIKELLKSITSDNVKLSNALLDVKIFAIENGDDELYTWCKHELEGYKSLEEVPEYRKFDVVKLMGIVNGQLVELKFEENTNKYINDVSKLLDSIASIESISSDDSPTIKYEPIFQVVNILIETIYQAKLTDLQVKVGKNSFPLILQNIKNELVGKLEKYISPKSQSKESKLLTDIKKSLTQKKVFIVHGKNYYLRTEVKKLLTSCGIIPIILSEQLDRGKTLIEKFETVSNECSAAIIIMSADDKMKDNTVAARPNVILEMGYFMGKIGRENIIVLKQREVTHYPSDIHGVVYKEYKKGSKDWRNKIIAELKDMGFFSISV